jgi:hypothetical protein
MTILLLLIISSCSTKLNLDSLCLLDNELVTIEEYKKLSTASKRKVLLYQINYSEYCNGV